MPDRARLQYTVELPWREAVRSNFNGFVGTPLYYTNYAVSDCVLYSSTLYCVETSL